MRAGYVFSRKSAQVFTITGAKTRQPMLEDKINKYLKEQILKKLKEKEE